MCPAKVAASVAAAWDKSHRSVAKGEDSCLGTEPLDNNQEHWERALAVTTAWLTGVTSKMESLVLAMLRRRVGRRYL